MIYFKQERRCGLTKVGANSGEHLPKASFPLIFDNLI
jgi:hypothetical protein